MNERRLSIRIDQYRIIVQCRASKRFMAVIMIENQICTPGKLAAIERTLIDVIRNAFLFAQNLTHPVLSCVQNSRCSHAGLSCRRESKLISLKLISLRD